MGRGLARIELLDGPSARMVVSWHGMSIIWCSRKAAALPSFDPFIFPVDNVNIKLRTEDLDTLQEPVKGQSPDTCPFKPEDQSLVASKEKQDDAKGNRHDETKYSIDISPESLLVSVTNDFNNIQCCEDISQGDGKRKKELPKRYGLKLGDPTAGSP